MPIFKKDSVSLHYEIHGVGKPVILLHGAVVDFNYNFVQTGWVNTLTDNGFQVVGLNFRGHGESDKSDDPNFYGTRNFSEDVIHLIHHLGLENVSLMGYSMGSVIALDLLHHYPEYFSKAVLMATGNGLLGMPPFILSDLLPGLANLLSYDEYPSHLPKHIATYWNFMQMLGADKKSTIAFVQGDFPALGIEEATSISHSVLIISGEKDFVLGQGEKVAEILPKGSYLEIKEANHFTLAISPQTHEASVKFLIKK